MTLVRFNKPATQSFNNLVGDFFTNLPSLLQDDFIPTDWKQPAPVNIRETDNSYVLELFVPGLEKEDFRINLENNTLTVSAEKKTEEAESKNEKRIRTEYTFKSFKRSFTVDENIDAANIAAKYTNGVLTLNLPRKEEVKEAAKQITIQ
jgi:HSP20 family protein